MSEGFESFISYNDLSSLLDTCLWLSTRSRCLYKDFRNDLLSHLPYWRPPPYWEDFTHKGYQSSRLTHQLGGATQFLCCSQWRSITISSTLWMLWYNVSISMGLPYVIPGCCDQLLRQVIHGHLATTWLLRPLSWDIRIFGLISTSSTDAASQSVTVHDRLLCETYKYSTKWTFCQ